MLAGNIQCFTGILVVLETMNEPNCCEKLMLSDTLEGRRRKVIGRNICSAELAEKIMLLCSIFVDHAFDLLENKDLASLGDEKFWGEEDSTVDAICKIGSLLQKMHTIERSASNVTDDQLSVSKEDIAVAMKFCNITLNGNTGKKKRKQ